MNNKFYSLNKLLKLNKPINIVIGSENNDKDNEMV